MKMKFNRKVKLYIAGLISIVAITAVSYYSFAKFYLAEDMIEAQNALKAGNNILAYKLLKKIIKDDSSNVEAHKLLAELNQKKGNYLQAVKLWASVQKLDPFDEKAVEMQTENMFTIGAYTAIIELLDNRYAENKCTSKEKIYLAKSYCALGKISDAEKIADKILKTRKNEPVAILLKGNLAFFKKNIKNAEEFYNKISTGNSDILSAKYIGQANCLEYQGKSNDAENLYLKADKLMNHSFQTTLILSNFYLKNNQRKKAHKLLESLYPKNKDNTSIIIPLAELYLQSGDYRKIQNLKEGITRNGILYIQLKYYLDALLLFLEKKYEDSLKYFEWAGDNFKNNSAYLTCAVYSNIKTKNTVEAAKYLKNIFNSNTPDEEINRIIAFATAEAQKAFLNNNLEFTYKICNIINQYDFKYIPAHILIMWYYFNQRRFTEAEVQANIILQANPDDTNAIEIKGRIALNNNNFKEAEKYFNKLIKSFPNNPLGYYWTGISYLKNKEYSKSLISLQKALEIKPDNPILISALYDLCLTTKNEKLISSMCARMLNSDRPNIKALANIYKAEKSLRKENLDSAVEYYKKAIKSTPNNIPYYLYLVKTLNKQKKHKEALYVLHKAEKISKGNRYVLFEFAYTYYQNNNLKLSENKFKEIIEKYPEWVLPIINLSQILSDQQGKLMEALELAKKAVTITPASYLSRYNLAEIYFLDKNYTDALKEFKKALKYKPNDSNALKYCKKVEKILAKNKNISDK